MSMATASSLFPFLASFLRNGMMSSLPFPDTELVNSDVSDLVKGNFPIENKQFGSKGLFDHVSQFTRRYRATQRMVPN